MKNAMKWAKANGKTRNNPVHGAEEYRIATFENFGTSETNRNITSAVGDAELEVRPPLAQRLFIALF